jgi:hypothetical protein
VKIDIYIEKTQKVPFFGSVLVNGSEKQGGPESFGKRFGPEFFR